MSAFLLGGLSACSTNPATGQQQFTALMSPAQEMQVGATEHEKVMATYGLPENSQALQTYINKVGQTVAQNTERPDVQYKFFLLDDSMVNAFALPGGYVYVTRGLLAQANSEAELAAVLGHEVGHITGRHSAERYSRGVVTSLGAMVLSAALDSPTATQAASIGSDLFMKSYSRGQEHEADALGIRYLSRAGYRPDAMTGFLQSLNDYTTLEGRINGNSRPDVDWFSTHPLTADRVQQTVGLAGQYPANGNLGRDEYLSKIDGLIYGESAKHGFVRGNSFYHTEMGFMFSAPEGFTLNNQPSQVIATDNKGAVILFDAAANPQNLLPAQYLTQVWMKGEPLGDVETININGKSAATASFNGKVGNTAATIRIVAIQWNPNTFFRFQMAIPQNASAALVEELKRTTYSLRALTAAEKQSIKPYRIRIVTAKAGDTVASLARRMPYTTYQEERFRTLNALRQGEGVAAGQRYKLITE
ncbi:MAG: M48 family metalloprotease [Rhodospirillales bacterium]|nr:M48 family metalloprotease [Rhodospirillales bacterium]MCB9995925.1 M48 family metalloprotease [Rhodospirillales bacterium]